MLRTMLSEWGNTQMPIARACGLPLWLAALLGGCAGTQLAPEPAAGVSLAGAWKLDRGASDDPQKVLDQMRAEAFRLMSRRPSTSASRPATRTGREEREPTADEDLAQPPAAANGRRPDPLLRSPMAHVIMSTIARGDFLTIRQTPAEIVLDYGTSQRSFTPGARSVVSTEGGVGDQTSGWKGREYVIEMKAQLGPYVIERYGLSADGRQLVAKLHIGTAELPGVDLTRVYRPTAESAPRPLPSSD